MPSPPAARKSSTMSPAARASAPSPNVMVPRTTGASGLSIPVSWIGCMAEPSRSGSGHRVERWVAGEDGGDVVDGGVRGQDQAVDGQECGVDVGFVFEDVQGGAAEPSVAQGRYERGLVDDSAAGGIDQVGAGFHRGQRRV